MQTPNIRFRIDFTQTANLGPGKIELLEAIQKLGSLSDAVRTLEKQISRISSECLGEISNRAVRGSGPTPALKRVALAKKLRK